MMPDAANKIYMTRTCAECPWRKNVEPGRFPPERYEALVNTCRPGGIPKPMFACHKSPNGEEKACAGFLLVHGQDSNAVRLAVAMNLIDIQEVTAASPLYANFREMAQANGYDPGPDWDDQNQHRRLMPATTSRNVRWDTPSVDALKALYVKFNRTVDDIAADKALAADFNRQFSQKSGMSTTAEIVVRKLLNLRKKGAKNGGLPTLRH